MPAPVRSSDRAPTQAERTRAVPAPVRSSERTPARRSSTVETPAALKRADTPPAVGPAIRLNHPAGKDPRFKKVADELEQQAKRVKKHDPPGKKAAEAQAAAVPAPNERLAGAKANQVGAMTEAPAKKPEANAFLTMLRDEIHKVMPQNLEQADSFMESGETERVKDAVSGGVNQQTSEASSAIESATQQAPDPSQVPDKDVLPLSAEPTPQLGSINTAAAMPAPKANPQSELKESQQRAEQQLEQAELNPAQLKKANDPRFSAVLSAKTQVDQRATAAPGKYRSAEGAVLAQSAAKAQDTSRKGLGAMQTLRSQSGAQVHARQKTAQQRDEQRRREVVQHIETIYTETKGRVEAKLAGLETGAMALFEQGITRALSNLKTNGKREVERVKKQRYAGVEGKFQWAADLFRDINTLPEIKAAFVRAQQAFNVEMDALVVSISTLVESRLNEAKAEISQGQARIKGYVASLPADLQAVGRETEKQVSARFDELRQGVDNRANELAQKIAERYKEAQDKANEALEKLKEENKGALAGLAQALGEVVKILTEFKGKLMGLLRKGWDTIKLILDDPIGFLANLLAAIKGGIENFVNNIWNHLRKGFMQWLFGALAGAGIDIPTDLSLPSILKLVLSVLGITYERMRAKAVKLIGERNVRILEKVFEYVRALTTGGPAALWEKVKEDLGNLKTMVIDAIQNWLVETVIKQAVTKLVSMFNPVGAIVQALIAIYNTVMFLIERAQQISAFIEAIVGSVHAIATKAIGGAVAKIEESLGRAVPLVIGFLAQLIGLGGISQKIKDIIKKVQSVVDKAIDKAIAKIVGVVKKLFDKATGKDTREESEAQKHQRLNLGMAAAQSALNKFKGKTVGRALLRPVLSLVRVQYRLTALELLIEGKQYSIEGTLNPKRKERVTDVKVGDGTFKASIDFKRKESLDAQEFNRQLRLQQSELNRMTCQEFLKNRESFYTRKAEREARGVKYAEGRDPEGVRRVAEYNKRLRSLFLHYARMTPGATETQAQAMAEARLQELTKDNVALHRLDQVAGGSGVRLAGWGGAREDYSIGAAWPTRARELEDKIKAAEIPEDELQKTKLEIILTTNGQSV